MPKPPRVACDAGSWVWLGRWIVGLFNGMQLGGKHTYFDSSFGFRLGFLGIRGDCLCTPLFRGVCTHFSVAYIMGGYRKDWETQG